ncbi:hypothetical protein LTR94_028905, partial [Friedmanniomyces endolithicus]
MALIKICGLKTVEAVDAALNAGADFVGFVMVRASPRFVAPEEAAPLIARARGRARAVLLFADAGDTEIAALAAELEPDLIQLHGAETAHRVAEVRSLYGRPVIKAVG